MMMKIASFLRCGVVIILSLVAGRAGAQSDSLLVIVHFVGQNHSSSVSTTESIDTNHFPGPSIFVDLPSIADFTFNSEGGNTITDSTIYYLSDTTSFQWRNFFSIDSANSNFCSIRISLNYQGPNDYDNEFNNTSGEYTILFDSIPWKGNANELIKGYFPAHYTVNLFTFGEYGGGTYTGYSDSAGMEEDSLYIEINPSSSGVHSSQSVVASELHLLWSNTSNALSVILPLSYQSSTLEICDFLGRATMSITVPGGAESLELPNNLSPGCYFARLGDQVAKFVVPPR
jgi:hypothetical protein